MRPVLNNPTSAGFKREISNPNPITTHGQTNQRASGPATMQNRVPSNLLGFWVNFPTKVATKVLDTHQALAFFDPDLRERWPHPIDEQQKRRSISIHSSAQNLPTHLINAHYDNSPRTHLYIFLRESEDPTPPVDFTPYFMSLLQNRPSITTIALRIKLSHPLYDAMMTVLQSLDSTRMVTLDVELNSPGSPEQASQIALIKTLKRLELSFDGSYTNDSQHSDQKAWGLDIWMSALAAHDNLAELALDSIEQTYLGQKFSDALKNTRSVKKLQINFDHNTQDQARLICEGLIKNNSVRELDLQLDTIDLESICNVLRKNSTLEKLCLYLPELYQVVESNPDDEDIEAAKAAVEAILRSLICNTTLRAFDFVDFYKNSTYAVQAWPELSSLGHWLTQLMQRNDLHFRVLNDAGTWIYHSDWHQPINQFAVDDKGAAQPYIPREIAEQIAKAVVLMLRPAEASRILRALRVWDVPRIVEAGEDQ